MALELQVRSWGGARTGAGRKPSGKKGLVPHRKRPPHKRAHPLHVTLRVAADVRNLRVKSTFDLVRMALEAGADRERFRVLEYSVQANHLHLIVEASDNQALARGMQGLNIRLARAINKAQGRTGRVFPQRYHLEALTSPRRVRNALAYVLLNSAHHAASAKGRVDPCSSGRWFSGWIRNVRPEAPSPLPQARTFLLEKLWRRWGLISPEEIPGRRSRKRRPKKK